MLQRNPNKPVDLSDLSLYIDAAPHDPRFPMFQHLFDRHGWDTPRAFNYVNSELIKATLADNPPCPVCGKTIHSILLTDADA